MPFTIDASAKQFYARSIGLVLLLLLLYSFFNVISVFLGIFTFAIIFAVAFYSLFEKMVGWFGGRRKLASIVYGVLLVGIIAVPLVFLINWLTDSVQEALGFVQNIETQTIPPLPENISGLPVVGSKLSAFWVELQADPKAALHNHEAQVATFLQKLLSGGAGIAGTSLELILGIIISAVMLNGGTKILVPLKAALYVLAGEKRGDDIVDAAGRAINGVAVGVMGSAFIQAVVMFIALKIVGAPMIAVLTAITFLMAVIQLGPMLVAIPVTIWIGSQGDTTMAIVMGVFTVALFVIDNVVKPILIGKSGKLPILVLFLGVVGGMTAWGFTGMFKGAIILAVMYTLFNSWFLHSPDAKEAVAEMDTPNDE
ncbi:MAG TPA: AI-2E family transporter [Phnomibacter sp.]|nr:AI-2E family transporter [Phnomibacter sp.]